VMGRQATFGSQPEILKSSKSGRLNLQNRTHHDRAQNFAEVGSGERII
jgi:hypothetical protein